MDSKYKIHDVIIALLTEVFDRTVPSKILFPLPWNPYLKTSDTSLLTLFLVKRIWGKGNKIFEATVLSKNNDNNWKLSIQMILDNKGMYNGLRIYFILEELSLKCC